MSLRLEEEFAGALNVLYVVVRGERCEFRRFVQSLEPRDRKRVVYLLTRAAERGTEDLNVQQFRKLSGDIWEFKPTQQVRITCAWIRRGAIVLLTAFVKKHGSDTQPQIEKAQKLLDAIRSEPMQ